MYVINVNQVFYLRTKIRRPVECVKGHGLVIT